MPCGLAKESEQTLRTGERVGCVTMRDKEGRKNFES